jgi:hypothetical protein
MDAGAVMDDGQDERRRAAQALAAVRTHQERARRAARLPWWGYAAMFVLSLAGSAANDFVDLGGAKLLAAVVVVLFAAVLGVTVLGRSAPLSRVRGVQRRQSFDPRAFAAVAVVGGAIAALVSHYGTGFAGAVADGVGLRQYPNTVTGVVYGAVFTALFALSRLLTASQRRTNR